LSDSELLAHQTLLLRYLQAVDPARLKIPAPNVFTVDQLAALLGLDRELCKQALHGLAKLGQIEVKTLSVSRFQLVLIGSTEL